MKKSDTFKISSAWWKKEKPPALLKSGLGEALTAYETARGKLTVDPKTYVAARTALDAVEAGRLKALKNCGLIFPDAQVVLKGGGAAVNTERTHLQQSFHALLRARVDPIQAEITTEHGKLNGILASAKKLLAATPKRGQRVGKTPDDPKQKQMEQLVNKAAEYSYSLRARVTIIREAISNDQTIVNTARTQDPFHDFAKAITAVNAAIAEVRPVEEELSDLVDLWEGELQAVNNAFKAKRMFTA